ncbi:hypothetical protein FQA39_LY09103 [Lamprigera yunnana]|nr:hypothetical protein FQA39_LY09103 [Lamprigera yunnana]
MQYIYIPSEVCDLTDNETIDDETDITGNEDEDYDTSDDEALAERVQTPTWKKDEIEYTHSPLSNEFNDKMVLQEKLFGKTPLEPLNKEDKGRRVTYANHCPKMVLAYGVSKLLVVKYTIEMFLE